MSKSIHQFQHFYFIGVAGSGMSAIAQYLSALGKQISGSDRYFQPDKKHEIQIALEDAGVKCFAQDGSGLNESIDVVIVSTAIEPTVPEVQWAMQRQISIIKRSELLALITQTRKTIAVGGTSGKSTTSGMLYSILEAAGNQPGIITGAGLVQLMKGGKIGNAAVGDENSWLIIEADESDGSIVNYRPEIGLLLNIDKDHQEIEELMEVFGKFREHTKEYFIVNRSNALSASLTNNGSYDFSTTQEVAPIKAEDFHQEGWNINFRINDVAFKVRVPGRHNMENATAAIACALATGVRLEDTVKGLSEYEGIYRRHQLIGEKNGVMVVDDFGHNPVKCAASIRACQHVGKRVVAWFQPHGYGPTRFLKNDFIEEISGALREQDSVWMSEIYYAGGTAVKDISAKDLIDGIETKGKHAFFVENRNDLPEALKNYLKEGDILLLMGARDPSLEQFAKYVLEKI